jgi:GNAT superfamily N-acetyltransferase
MNVTIKRANQDDIPQLAVMNHQLIQDEGSRNPMEVEQLGERMQGWLDDGWTALLVIVGEDVAGYMLYQQRVDDYFLDQKEVFIRQFFIRRGMRGQGIGRQAIEVIVGAWLPSGATLMLEVMAGNEVGLAFWERVGFEAYSVAMRREG